MFQKVTTFRALVPGGSKVVILDLHGGASCHFGPFQTSFWSISGLILDKFRTNARSASLLVVAKEHQVVTSQILSTCLRPPATVP